MKIKLNGLLDNILNNKEKAEFSDSERKGYVKNEEAISKKQGVKILTSMVLLIFLTLSLGFRLGEFNDLVKGSKVDTSKIYAKPLDSVATFSSVEDVDNELVFATKYEEKLIFSKPLDGQIQKIYSPEKVVFSKTLNKWKTHDGIDVASEEGTLVLSMEKGEVINVYDDALLGKTIVISHIAGYYSQYSNLDENVFVSVGDKVVKGQRIGRVGKTAKSEFLDDSHLHLAVYLGEKSVDPTYIFN